MVLPMARWARCLALSAAGMAFLLGPPAVLARETLPPAVLLALQRARVPLQAVAVHVQAVDSGEDRLSHNAQAAMNPASLAKLLTTSAALDRLGPAWRWSTPVWISGPVRDGVLDGSVTIQGSGDPTLVVERVWLLLHQLQLRGVREITGDIVLDRSAFAMGEGRPVDFDGEADRPYNVQPDALLLNFGAVSYRFVPEPARGSAQVIVEPALDGAAAPQRVPLLAGPCADWRSALRATLVEGQVRFVGGYAAGCGEQVWHRADPQPASYAARLIAAMWQQMGGRLRGTVHDGRAPVGRPPSFEQSSPPLLDVVRDINKFSNNVMAEQLFLTLARVQAPDVPATGAAARAVLRRWLVSRHGDLPDDVVLDNGSGLSRETRVTAQFLGRVLLSAFDSPWMPELMGSLPLAGVDGTLRRSTMAVGRAHLKTGSLRDVAGVAGYVLADSGRRYVLVAIINHPRALAARPALDALVQWTLHDMAAR